MSVDVLDDGEAREQARLDAEIERACEAAERSWLDRLDEEAERAAETADEEWLYAAIADDIGLWRPGKRRPVDGRPVIRLGPELANVVDECVAALADRARELGVYQRGHRLVFVTSISLAEAAASPVVSVGESGEKRRELVAGTPVIHTMEPATLKEVLTRVARFEKWDGRANKGEEWKRCIPVDAVVHAVHARRKWIGIPNLIGVAAAPFMRPDGTVCQTPGFDAATGWLYAPSRKFPRIKENPTQVDAMPAYKLVEEIFIDFPFEPVTHRSVPIAAALTELTRPSIDGCIPASVFNGNHRGVGKSLLTDAIANITTGRDMPRRTCPHGEEEMEKVIGAYAMQGAIHLSLDNVSGDFGGPTIDAILSTPGDWEPRILGKSKIPSVPWRAAVYVTGHHFSFAEGSDTCDRVLMAYLQTELENPRTRTGFRHPRLRKWIRDHQGELVCALLTMARAWVVAGRPPQEGCPNWGTYEEWAAIIPHIIVFSGGPSPMLARVREEVAVSDAQRAIACILDAWPKLEARVAEQEQTQWRKAADDATKKDKAAPKEPPKRAGLTAAELRHALYADDLSGAAQGSKYGPPFDAMREAIETLCCPRQRAGRIAPLAHAISKKLQKRKDTNIGGKRLRNALNRESVAVWWVEDVAAAGAPSVPSAGVAGVAGVVQPVGEKLSDTDGDDGDDSSKARPRTSPATPATPARRKAGRR